MCFSTALLRVVPHRAYSVVEDVEYGLRLGEAGRRVHYTDEAHVYGEMVTGAAAAKSQRRRWEEGRKLLVKANAGRLLRAGLRGDRVLLDLALDLLVPPLSTIALSMLIGSLAGAGLMLGMHGTGVALSAYGAGLGAVALYVLRGWMLSGTGLRGLVDLGLAPVYVAWKLALRFRRPERATSDWVRTERETRDAPP
jgi:hypothetical protein